MRFLNSFRLSMVAVLAANTLAATVHAERPNVLIAFADDWVAMQVLTRNWSPAVLTIF